MTDRELLFLFPSLRHGYDSSEDPLTFLQREAEREGPDRGRVLAATFLLHHLGEKVAFPDAEATLVWNSEHARAANRVRQEMRERAVIAAARAHSVAHKPFRSLSPDQLDMVRDSAERALHGAAVALDAAISGLDCFEPGSSLMGCGT